MDLLVTATKIADRIEAEALKLNVPRSGYRHRYPATLFSSIA